jgi:excinuclease UvrABC nuclease subunit
MTEECHPVEAHPLFDPKRWTCVDHFPERHEGPEMPGVYMLWRDDELLYIGQSANLRQRLAHHHRNRRWYTRVEFIEVADETARLEFERQLIDYFKPLNNTVHTGRYRPKSERRLFKLSYQ